MRLHNAPLTVSQFVRTKAAVSRGTFGSDQPKRRSPTICFSIAVIAALIQVSSIGMLGAFRCHTWLRPVGNRNNTPKVSGSLGSTIDTNWVVMGVVRSSSSEITSYGRIGGASLSRSERRPFGFTAFLTGLLLFGGRAFRLRVLDSACHVLSV